MKLKTYEDAWRIENKIYSLQNLRLPVPIALSALAYYSITCAVVLLLNKVFPIISNIPPVLRFGALPYFVTEFLRKKKFDGKPPHMFLKDYIPYIFTKHINIEFFRVPERQNNGVIKLDWSCTHRNT